LGCIQQTLEVHVQAERVIDRRESVFNVTDGEIVELLYGKARFQVDAIRVEYSRKAGGDWALVDLEVHGWRALKDGSLSTSSRHSQRYFRDAPEWLAQFASDRKDEVTA
jgi:hypothetical protein